VKEEDHQAAPNRRSDMLGVIVRVGLIAGTLDIADSLIFNAFPGITPGMIFQYIASGLVGLRAFHWGGASVALGVVIHYFVALTWTAVFYLASRRFAILSRRPVISGLLYGVAVYLFMDLVALPLSGVPRPVKAVTLASRINGVLALMICIGLTVSMLLRRAMVRTHPS
jgi:uncharacterized membrane protein YagU involved in acid resistance